MVGSSQKGCFIEKPAWCDWPLKKLRVRQLGWWNSLTEWKRKFHVPNHQPDPTRYILLHLAKKCGMLDRGSFIHIHLFPSPVTYQLAHYQEKHSFQPTRLRISSNINQLFTRKNMEISHSTWVGCISLGKLVNYYISLTWNVVPLGDSCPLLITIPGLGRTEVIRVYTECGYIPIDVH